MAAPPIGLAVFGAGRIGAIHARNVASLAPAATLVGIADADAAAAQRALAQVACGRVDTIDALLRDDAVQGVIVATPTASHAELIAQAAAARKHVLCEKPISLSLAATERAIEAAHRADILLQVGFQRRFDAEFARARALIEDGRLGALRFLRLVGRDHRVPSLEYLRTSGGQFKDQMVHEFDLARWLMSPLQVDEVYATGSTLIDERLGQFGDMDTTVAVLRYHGGALAVIDGGREAAYGYDVRAEIQGAKGVLLVGHSRFAHGIVMDESFASPDVDSFVERFADAYRAEVEDFAEAIAQHRAPRVGGQDALEALRLAVAADRSLRARRPVSLAETHDD